MDERGLALASGTAAGWATIVADWPAPAVLLDCRQCVQSASASAREALGALTPGTPLAQWLRPLVPADEDPIRPRAPRPTHRAAQAGATQRWWQARTQRLEGGATLLALQPCDDSLALADDLARCEIWLDVACAFGRTGFWERRLPDLEGHWDPHTRRIFGIAADAPAPDLRRALEITVAEDRPGLTAAFTQSLGTPGRYNHRYRLQMPDGTLRPVHSHWAVVAGADGRPERVLGVVMDDSEPMRMAKAAQDLQRTLETVVELAGLAVWRHDVASDRFTLRGAALSALGYEGEVSRSEAASGVDRGQLLQMVHRDDLPRLLTTRAAAEAAAGAVDCEVRLRHREGTWRQFLLRRVVQRDAEGRILAHLGVGLDVTERRQAQRELALAHEQVALAVRGAGMGTWVADIEHSVVEWDEAMWQLRGRTGARGVVAPEQIAACLAPEERERMPLFRERALADQGLGQWEFRVQWPDGSLHWLASRSTVFEHDGRRLRVGVNWDITATREAESVRAEAELAQRGSRAKSEFLARMSHELRTPLNAVLGFTQLLLQSPDHPDRRQWLEHVQAAGAHLLALINDVLDLSRIEAQALVLRREVVALPALLHEALTLLGDLPRQHGVVLQLVPPPPDLPPVGADPQRLRQVLLNLLSNGAKYNRRGGTLRVACERSGAGAVVHVDDEGPGLSDEQLAHLFEPFNRLGREGGGVEGTGVGLTISRALAEAMGARLEVHSTPGRGSRFSLWVPAAETADPAPLPAVPLPRDEPVAMAAGSPAPARHRVLYVEDNPVNALIMQEWLARRGDVELQVCPDGSSGLAALAAAPPSLLLLDMQLPDMDGLALLARVRADPALRGLPVAVLSANALPADIDRALQAGADVYWTKPLDLRVFSEALDRQFGPDPTCRGGQDLAD